MLLMMIIRREMFIKLALKAVSHLLFESVSLIDRIG